MKINTGHVDPVHQGFLTNKGRFVNRVEAYGAKQFIKPSTMGGKAPELFSEDLW